MAKKTEPMSGTTAPAAPPAQALTVPQVPALQASTNGLIGVPPINPDLYPIVSMPSEEVRMMLDNYIGAGGISAFDLPRLKVPGSGGTQWKIETLMGTQHVDAINGVVLYWRPTRAKWDKEYGKAPVGPPQCKSDDGITGKGNPGGSCRTCPLKDFGANGEKPLCKQKMMIFFLPEGQRVPSVLFAPTKSIPPMQKYFLRLMSAGVPSYFCVASRLALKQDKNSAGTEYSFIDPTVNGVLAGEHLTAIKEYVKGMRPVFEKFTPNEEDLRGGDGDDGGTHPAEVG